MQSSKQQHAAARSTRAGLAAAFTLPIAYPRILRGQAPGSGEAERRWACRRPPDDASETAGDVPTALDCALRATEVPGGLGRAVCGGPLPEIRPGGRKGVENSCPRAVAGRRRRTGLAGFECDALCCGTSGWELHSSRSSSVSVGPTPPMRLPGDTVAARQWRCTARRRSLSPADARLLPLRRVDSCDYFSPLCDSDSRVRRGYAERRGGGAGALRHALRSGRPVRGSINSPAPPLSAAEPAPRGFTNDFRAASALLPS